NHREEEREIIPLCENRGVARIPWSPLAGGRVPRPWGTQTKRSQIDGVSPLVWGATEAADKVGVDILENIGQLFGVWMAQVALAWMVSIAFITAPIVCSTAIIL
ncbi:aldo/keto reductase, partial [Klebsiella variicola]|uniref:aldo/keto reductase n=1 Tax=Klebsiella variicola TaxID=244366 RepID=UPI0027308B24